MTFIRRDVLRLSAPIFTEQVFTMSIGVLNTIMAARIGVEAVSAVGMVNSLTFILIAFFSALAVGGTVVVAHFTGQDNTQAANEATKQALFSGLILSLIVTVLIWIFRYPVVNLLFGSAEQEVIKDSIIYLQITLLTYPLLAITSIACGVLRGAGDTKTPMKINILMNAISIIVSYILIYGMNIKIAYFHIHITGMKIEGAALGILIARAIGAFLVMFSLIKGSTIIKLVNIRSFKIDFALQKSIFNIGIPSSIESLMFNGGKLITQIFIVNMGMASIAANAIAGSFASIINIPGSAFSIVAPTLVGQSMGKGKSDESKKLLIYITVLSSVCLLVLCAVSFPLADLISSLYTKSTDVIHLTSTLIKLTAIATPLFWSISFVLPSGLNGAGDTKYTMVTSVIGMWAFRIVLGYVFGISFKMGVAGVWVGMYIDWVVRGTLYCFRLKNEKWKQNVVVKSIDLNFNL